MNKLFSLGAFALLLAFAACKSDTKTGADAPPNPSAQEDPTALAGHWFPMDFCARANQYGSVLAAMNNGHLPYAYAITFGATKTDSVTCYDGIKSWKLAAKFNVDTVELQNAFQGKSVFLVYDSKGNKEMTMFNTTKGRTEMDRFIKSRATTDDGYKAFLIALNHNVLQGNFKPVGKGASTEAVQFSSGGTINNLKEYNRYRLCTGGDCFVAGDQYDVITLMRSDDANSPKDFAFKYNGQNDTLSIYQLSKNPADEKAAATVGALVYRFARTIPKAAPSNQQPQAQPQQQATPNSK
ncbi:MAG: hypothetical protein J0L99_18645 [Chitinophagales bacterium]|jgi:hypothetical protein|nr:hypothetical protein [Chitinophagales bacterium]